MGYVFTAPEVIFMRPAHRESGGEEHQFLPDCSGMPQPDGWLERLMEYIEEKNPSNEVDRELFAHAISEALKEVTMRIEKENERLISIANAQLKFQKKPT